jgi:hypothetical protein
MEEGEKTSKDEPLTVIVLAAKDLGSFLGILVLSLPPQIT